GLADPADVLPTADVHPDDVASLARPDRVGGGAEREEVDLAEGRDEGAHGVEVAALAREEDRREAGASDRPFQEGGHDRPFSSWGRLEPQRGTRSCSSPR